MYILRIGTTRKEDGSVLSPGEGAINEAFDVPQFPDQEQIDENDQEYIDFLALFAQSKL